MRRPPKSRARVGGDQAVDPAAVRRAALLLLSRRDYSGAELQDKLCGRGFAAAEVAAIVTELQEERLLDDTRYAANFVAGHAGRGQGPARIRQDLAAAGLGAGQIAEALEAGPDFAARCREVRARRFGAALPVEWKDKARQARFLQYRGFSADHIRSAFGPDFDPEE